MACKYLVFNARYQSTLHRVIHTKDNYRISVPFFFEPSFDSKISPLPNCVRLTGGVKIYQEVLYGDHLLSKVKNNFDIKEQNEI